MKFIDLTVFKHKDAFDLAAARNWIDAYLLFNILKSKSFSSILEIGFLQGFTFGLIYETIGKDKDFISCDINFKNSILHSIIDDFKNVRFLESDSKKLQFTNECFDFVNIDGKHDYEHVSKELSLIYPYLSDDCIVMLDDCDQFDGVHQAAYNFCKTHEFVPIIIGHQQVFFAKKILSENLLKNIQDKTKMFVSWDYKKWEDWQIPRYRAKADFVLSKFPELILEVENY
jgi:SAM-dependent methyltransferase